MEQNSLGIPAEKMRRLTMPRDDLKKIQATVKLLARAERDELSPAALWLLDNARLLYQKAAALRDSLRALPPLPVKNGEIAVFALAKQIAEAGRVLKKEDIILCARRYMNDGYTLTETELCALKAALSLYYLEKTLEVCDLLCDEARAGYEAKRVFQRVRTGNFSRLPDERGAAEKLKRLLAEAGEKRTLALLEAHLQKRGFKQEKNDADQALDSLRSAVLSLRASEHIRFDRLGEELSAVADVLKQDTAFEQMDRESRGVYRARVADIARRLSVGEVSVARTAVALASGGTGAANQAGYYLFENQQAIAASLGKRARRMADKTREGLYAALFFCLFALYAVIGVLCKLPWYAVIFLALSLSELGRQAAYPLLLKRYRPRPLPRFQLKRIPKDQRTLIVVPTLLTDKKQALSMVRRLSVLRALSPEANLDFMLLGDLKDADAPQDVKDEDLKAAALSSVEALNEAYGDVYSLLIRDRVYSKSEERYIARERKRGALETLFKLIAGEPAEDTFCAASIDVKELQGKYAYIITLDADTLLLPGDARRLIGAMEHPLQKGRIAVIQPVMRVLPATVKTRAQRLLGGKSGMPAYAGPAQDIYQDIFGRGSFVGKGIINPEMFLKRTKGKMKKERILSHDLLEGELAGAALAEDIALLDGHPRYLSGWYKRLHRWTRGDWQLLPYLFSRALSPLSRFKILDNLRRSAVPVAQIGLMLYAAWSGLWALAIFALPWPVHGIFMRLWFLPAKAYACLSGTLIALFRMLVSRKHFLTWVTAQETENGNTHPFAPALAQAAVGTALLLAALFIKQGALLFVPIGLFFVALPLFSAFFDGEFSKTRPLHEEQREEVAALARDTFQFFNETVTHKTHFLPPDNLQIEPFKGVAMRTSPTNIGLYLMSLVSSELLSFIDSDTMGRRILETVETMEKLPKYNGHFYNWYDLESLRPLEPLFVSSVDEGNLAACLLVCAQAVRKNLRLMDMALRTLPKRLDALREGMRLEQLLSRSENLFAIGLNADTGRLTEGCYDLLASESLLLSYVAVMTGQAPTSHFARLGRPLTNARGPVLLSWGGTMFEYLMPCLILPLINNTLLDVSVRRAVSLQRRYNVLRPYGVSESGYYTFDESLNYQYRAFGLPELSLAPDTESSVVAPYASMLTLPICPHKAVENLKSFKRMNMYGSLGLYEALDYGKQRSKNPPARVVSHMAHHQGMVLCAACNCLTDGALIDLFTSLPNAEAYQYLLCDEAPRRGVRLPPPPVKAVTRSDEMPGERELLPGSEEMTLLSAAKTSWAIGARGQGFLKTDEYFLTRFDEIQGKDSGPQFYLRDTRSGAYLRPAVVGRARAGSSDIVYEAAEQGFKVRETRFLSPMEGAAIARFDIESSAEEERELELISLIEPTLSTLAADLSHPNFTDLFIIVEAVSKRALVAKRRPREKGENPPLLLHAFLGRSEALLLQGDRALFLGRTGGYAHPKQLLDNIEDAANRLGGTVMPCLSIRAKIKVPPQGKISAAFLTAAAPDQEACDKTLRSFSGLQDIEAAFHLSKTQSELALRALNADQMLLELSARLLPRVVYMKEQTMSAQKRQALWAFSLSGDRPIVLLIVPKKLDERVVARMLRLHALWALRGVLVDFVFLCGESEGYETASESSIRALISVSAAPRDALFVLPLTDQNEHVLSAAARLTLDLSNPESGLLEAPPIPLETKKIMPTLPPALPDYENKNTFGGFSGERGYLVARPAPQPWCNLLCTPRFGTLVCETGILYSALDNSRMKRLTRRPLSVLNPESAETIELIDVNGARFMAAAGSALHEPGVTTYYGKSAMFETTLVCFTDAELAAGVRQLTIKNTSREPLRLMLSWRVDFAMGETPEMTYIKENGSLISAAHPDFDETAYAVLPGGRAVDGALTIPVQMETQRSLTIAMILCYAKEDKACGELVETLTAHGVNARLRLVRSFWEERLSALQVLLDDLPLTKLLNTFLPYQTRAARLYMRCGLYQAGGAFGFRDQLQDMLALLLTEPEDVRAHLLNSARHQFEEGDVQHWWHEPRTGVRTRITDDLLFLPYVTALYVTVTGDTDVLRESVPYLKSEELKEGEFDRYETPEVSKKSESLREHCLRAIERVRFGAHGLPLMGGGDWNDGMNKVGGEKGESVWLGFFLCVVLENFAPMSGRTDELLSLKRRVLRAADDTWTGEWYLRAYHDDGREIGGAQSPVPRIDLISQCFSALAGVPRDRARTALHSAIKLLFDEETGVFKLLDPPFKPEENAGYIGSYLPGVRENGGQYTHAVPWMVLALLSLSEINEAWRIFRAAMPYAHADSEQKAKRYKTEPYVVSADIYAGENMGRGGWTWYTGSAAWLNYAFFTGLMGLHKQGDTLRFTPSLPPDLNECTVIYRYQDTTYELIADSEARGAKLDGERLADGIVHLKNDGRTHTVRTGVKRQTEI